MQRALPLGGVPPPSPRGLNLKDRYMSDKMKKLEEHRIKRREHIRKEMVAGAGKGLSSPEHLAWMRRNRMLRSPSRTLGQAAAATYLGEATPKQRKAAQLGRAIAGAPGPGERAVSRSILMGDRGPGRPVDGAVTPGPQRHVRRTRGKKAAESYLARAGQLKEKAKKIRGGLAAAAGAAVGGYLASKIGK